MKIISKFKDYYDSSSVYNDDRIIFKRETMIIKDKKKYYSKNDVIVKNEKQEIKLPLNHIFLSKIKSTSEINTYYDFYIDMLYFCGKVYPVFVKRKYVKLEDKDKITIFSTIEDFKSAYFKCKEEHVKDKLKSWREKDLKNTLLKIEDVVNSLKENNSVDLEMFRSYGVYFLRKTDETVIYPQLKDVTKALKMDSFVTYQEIEMFLSGVLGVEEKDVVSISDKDLRDSKGFDNYSFKKRKSA